MANRSETHVSERDLLAASRAYVERVRGKRGPKRIWERIDLGREIERAARWLAKQRGLTWSQDLSQDPEIHGEARELAGRLYMKRLRRQGLLPPKHERPICRAKCRDGHACKARAVFNPHTNRMSKRCKWHGGLSTGPRSPAAQARALLVLALGRAILAGKRVASSS